MNNFSFGGSYRKASALQWGVSLDTRVDNPTIPVIRGAAILLARSSNIADNAATATTAQLTAPAGKTAGTHFQAGNISDDTNPLPSIDLAADKYTELEFCFIANSIIATNGKVYEFRVVDSNQTTLNAYLVTPEWTIGTPGGGGGLGGPILLGKCIYNKTLYGTIIG